MTHLFKRRILALCTVMILLLSCLALPAAWDTPPTPLPASSTPRPSPSATASQTPSPRPRANPSPTDDPALPAWQNFPPPSQPLVTAVPPRLTGLNLPDSVEVGVLLGADVNAPFVGRTDAVMLFFYNPETSRASFLSLPPDLLVYLPGYSMQRLQNAYPLGGMRLLALTLEYNLGVRPSTWALVQMDNFARFVDSLGGLDIAAGEGYPSICGGIPPGKVHLDGKQALCFVRNRQGLNEASRSRRQQIVLRQIFERMVRTGTLVRLPDLYNTFQSSVQTNLSLEKLLGYVPLALNLGDSSRVQMLYLPSEAFSDWTIPGPLPNRAFLPDRAALRTHLQQSVDFVLTPAPPSPLVATLVYELTISPTPTHTPTITRTPTRTPTVTRTRTPAPTWTRTPTFTDEP